MPQKGWLSSCCVQQRDGHVLGVVTGESLRVSPVVEVRARAGLRRTVRSMTDNVPVPDPGLPAETPQTPERVMGTAVDFDSPVLDLESTPSLGHDEVATVLVNTGVSFRQTAETYSGSEPVHHACYGTVPVLFSAVHATPHRRQGNHKGAERMTGALAIALANALDASVILPVAAQPDDPNFDMYDDAPFKQVLANILGKYRLVLDIHGMADHWGPDICIGVGDELRDPSLQLLLRNLE